MRAGFESTTGAAYYRMAGGRESALRSVGSLARDTTIPSAPARAAFKRARYPAIR